MNTTGSNQGNSDHPSTGRAMDSSSVGTENLANQIAGMSKHQLYQIVSQMKELIQKNQQQARQILIANPQLTKTLFQAQIMLGMVRAPDVTPPPLISPSSPVVSSVQTQPSQHPSIQTPALHIPPTPSPQSVGMFQSLSSPQPASQQPPPQVGFSHLQQAQQTSTQLQASQPSFVFPQSLPTPSPPLVTSIQQQLPVQHASSQPPVPSHPPPLPQHPRPLAPLAQGQQQVTQGVGFSVPPVPQSYHPQIPYLQQATVSVHSNVGPPFHQMHAPPLPSQPPPQHMFQVESGRGMSMGMPSTSVTWNQALPSVGPTGIPLVTPAAQHMTPSQSSFGGVVVSSSMGLGAGSSGSQMFGQPLIQQPLQPSHQPQQQPQQQPQMTIALEQQKALLQQVMNLTPEQINCLPPEQRQQVLQLQQAFRGQNG